MTYAFGEFEIDEDRYQLQCGGDPVKIEPHAFDVLLHLLRNRDRVVTKKELLATLWPGQFVTDAALTYCVKQIRHAVGDDGQAQRVISTIHGRGYRFIAALTSASPRSDSNPQDPFVGREGVMEELTAVVKPTTAGRGTLVLLAGEPGIGKTRTADELAQVARTQGMQVLLGSCYEGEGAPAFWPWHQVIAACAAAADDDRLLALLGSGAGDLVRLVPELMVRLPQLQPGPGFDSTQARFRLFASVSNFLVAASRDKPLMIVLDDLHWADLPSLRLLEFVARDITTARVLLLATYRDTDIDARHPLTHTLGALARVPSSHRIALRGLSEKAVAAFITAVSGETPTAGFAGRVHRETEGNPFFVNEVVRLTLRQGIETSPPRRLPETVRDAISRRLDKLPAPCRQLLKQAAVLGREFDFATLVEMHAGKTKTSGRVLRDRLLKVLDLIRGFGILEASPDAAGRYRFHHALIRETIYDSLDESSRVKLHQRAGDALERQRRRGQSAPSSLLAHHFRQAALGAGFEKAIDYAKRAATEAAVSGAYEEAASHYQHALALLPDHSSARIPLIQELGTNQWRAGDVSTARSSFVAAADLARRKREPQPFACAALGYGGGFRGFDVGVVQPELISLLEEALQRLGKRSPVLRARVLARLAVALYHVPDSLDRRRQLSHEAVVLAKRAGDQLAHLSALYSCHWALWGPDNLPERIQAADEMIALARSSGDEEMELHAHRFRLFDAIEGGDAKRLELEITACADLSGRLRQPYYEWYVATVRTMMAIMRGELDAAEGLSRAALHLGERAQSSNVHQAYHAQLAILRYDQGRLAEFEPAARAMIESYRALSVWPCYLTYLCAELGQKNEARRELDRLAQDRFSTVIRDTFWLMSMSFLADACAILDHRQHAATLYPILVPYRRRMALSIGGGCFTSIDRVLGRLASTLGRSQEAEAHFENAVAIEQSLGAKPLAAHTLRDYGHTMIRVVGDQRRGQLLLGRARALYEELGMTTFVRRLTATPLTVVGKSSARSRARNLKVAR